jgi:hypothetical protein
MCLGALELGTLLLDASTVQFLRGHIVYHALTGSYWADERVADILRNILAKQVETNNVALKDASDYYALTHALSFLEQWVIAEKLVVDKNALRSFAMHNPSVSLETLSGLSTLYDEIEVPATMCKDAARNVMAFLDTLRNLNKTLQMPEFDELPLKNHHYNHINAHLGVSGNNAARALFYLELSRLANLPLMLHPEKAAYLKVISKGVEDGVASIYGGLVDGVRGALKLEKSTIPIPPIADEILRTARLKRCSLLEAATDVRASQEMIALRSIVWELASIPRLGQRIRYEHEIAVRSKEIADSIQSRAVAGTRISRREIDLAGIPAIGMVFKILGGGKITVPDLVLHEQPHIALFSRWANEAHLAYA